MNHSLVYITNVLTVSWISALFGVLITLCVMCITVQVTNNQRESRAALQVNIGRNDYRCVCSSGL